MCNKIDKLYGYVMTCDTGFAPNPFFGICTLACCKPTLRKAIVQYIEKSTSNLFNKTDISSLNIWIAGIGGKGLANKSKSHNEGDLIYLMQVTDIVTIEQYSNDPKYGCKIPSNPDFFSQKRKNCSRENTSYKNCGDTIYIYHTDHTITQRPSFHKNCVNSCKTDMDNDLSGNFVLISNHYVYFGATPVCSEGFRIKNNRGYSSNYTKDERDSFASFINTIDFTKPIQGKPTECAVNFGIGEYTANMSEAVFL